MGKVIINKTDATKTASNGSRESSQREKSFQRAHVDTSKKTMQAQGDGVKMSNPKNKTATRKGAVQVAPKTRQLPATTRGVEKAAKVTTTAVAIRNPNAVAKSTKPVATKRRNMKQLGAGETGRDRVADPEITLMASRTAALEQGRIDITRISKRGGKSMSGMVVETARPVAHAGRASVNVAAPAKPSEEKSKDTERASRAKSALIGVGVAVVVAVIGFAGIALFGGSNKNMCTVHFESNGGSQVEGTEIVCGRTVAQPDDPVKEGFSFVGWILEGDPFDFDTGIHKDATLVASWKANDGTEVVTVRFDTDGGSVIKDIEIAKGQTVSIPTAPTKMGYVFEDWYLGDEVYDFSKPVEENITLKAKWERRESSGNTNTASTSKRATSISVASSLSLKVGASQQLTVTVLPAAAEYTLSAVSSDENVVTCSVNKNVINCTAKNSGNATVRVRDSISGQMTQMTVSVTDDLPSVDPGEEQPPVVDPGEEKPDDPPVVPEHTHTDSDGDGKCDICGEAYTTPVVPPTDPEEPGPEEGEEGETA